MLKMPSMQNSSEQHQQLMDTALEGLLSLAARPPDELAERDICCYMRQATEAMGFDYFSFGHQQSLPMSNPRFTWLSNYPAKWTEHYVSAGYARIDPRIERARQMAEPFVWNEPLFANTPTLWQALRSHGLHLGWTVSVLNHPPGISMLSLARRESPLDEKEASNKSQGLQRLAQLVHVVLVRLVCHRLAQDLPALTGREIEVLQWTADGKSAQDIAEILSLSKNTVDFHIKNSVHKLNAPNKTAAVMRAALLGLLH